MKFSSSDMDNDALRRAYSQYNPSGGDAAGGARTDSASGKTPTPPTPGVGDSAAAGEPTHAEESAAAPAPTSPPPTPVDDPEWTAHTPPRPPTEPTSHEARPTAPPESSQTPPSVTTHRRNPPTVSDDNSLHRDRSAAPEPTTGSEYTSHTTELQLGDLTIPQRPPTEAPRRHIAQPPYEPGAPAARHQGPAAPEPPRPTGQQHYPPPGTTAAQRPSEAPAASQYPPTFRRPRSEWPPAAPQPPQGQYDSAADSRSHAHNTWPPTRPPAPEDYGHPAQEVRFGPSSRRAGFSDPGGDRSFTLQNQRREGPQQGWRGALHRMHVPVGKGQNEIDFDLDIARINKVIRYPKVIGFASPKGGVGKTVSAMAVASTIAAHRQKGEVVAVDTDHNGSLARRVRGDQISSIKRFVEDGNLHSTNDVKAHMQSNHHRLSVLGSSREPLESPLTADEYLDALQILQTGHLFTIVDMDTSAATPAYETIMRSLDALVVVTATSLDSAEASQDMMDWIRARGLTELSTRTVVLINHQSPAKPHLDLDATVSHFRNTEAHEVREIHWDEHLAEAGPINLDLLNKATKRAFVSVAALLVDSLPSG